jgi:hypothetical protein
LRNIGLYPLPPAGRPTSKLTAGLVAPTGLPRRRRCFRLQDAPPGVAASACRTPGVRARDRTRRTCKMPHPASLLPPAGRLALEHVARIRRACNSASPPPRSSGPELPRLSECPANVLAHGRVCRRSFTRRPCAQLAEPARRSSLARDSTPGCSRWMQSRRHGGSSTSVGMIVWTIWREILHCGTWFLGTS